MKNALWNCRKINYLVMEYKQANKQVSPGIDQIEYANLWYMKYGISC